jgi:imidazole glycerol-phosphate synthase subunit HisH
MAVIVDYGMGNLLSVESAVRYLGGAVEVSAVPEKIATASQLILPGVGSFRRAMESLRSSGMDEAIRVAVLQRGANLLGICLGMQLLGTLGTEDGETAGLGLIDQRVDAFAPSELTGRKIPHIGFSAVTAGAGSRLFAGLPEVVDFYFVHSFRMPVEIPDTVVSWGEHGVRFAAAVEKDTIFGTQFHPEKSQTNGLLLLRNFLAL